MPTRTENQMRNARRSSRRLTGSPENVLRVQIVDSRNGNVLRALYVIVLGPHSKPGKQLILHFEPGGEEVMVTNDEWGAFTVVQYAIDDPEYVALLRAFAASGPSFLSRRTVATPNGPVDAAPPEIYQWLDEDMALHKITPCGPAHGAQVSVVVRTSTIRPTCNVLTRL